MNANNDSSQDVCCNTPVNSSYYEGENVAMRIMDLFVCDGKVGTKP